MFNGSSTNTNGLGVAMRNSNPFHYDNGADSHFIFGETRSAGLGTVTDVQIVLPQSFGDWSTAGSDGRRWIGCMSCHATNGAYRTVAYRSISTTYGQIIPMIAGVASSATINSVLSYKVPKVPNRLPSPGPLKNISGNLEDAANLARNQPYGPNTNVFRRLPRSAQDVLALEGAMNGLGRNLNIKLGDPRYQGWEKWHYSVGPKGSKSVVHYLRNPDTGFLTDFKFK